MNKSQMDRFIKDVQAYNDCMEARDALENQKEPIENQLSKLKGRLFEDRSKGYVRDAIKFLKEAIRDGLDKKWPHILYLLMEAEDRFIFLPALTDGYIRQILLKKKIKKKDITPKLIKMQRAKLDEVRISRLSKKYNKELILKGDVTNGKRRS